MWNILRKHKPFLVLSAFDCRIWSIMANMNLEGAWEFLRKTIGLKTLRLVRDICKFQAEHNRFFLVENPQTSKAWKYHGILCLLLHRFGGKFAVGDQCCFGKRDPINHLPERKRTGWLSHSEILLNPVCRQCTCPHGSHQQIVGNNAWGNRASQAAEYPLGLCRHLQRN